VLSVAADDPDVQASDVTYRSEAEVGAYLARPAAAGTYPGVIVIHENRGLTDHIKDVTRRLAKAGYVALAPDLVSRMGGTTSMQADQVASALGQATPEQLVQDLNAGVDFLLQQTGVNSDKVGVVGFCFGGAYTLRLAAANPKIAAAVPYYGVTPEPASQMADTNAAIMGQYGGADQRVNNSIPALEQALQGAGKTFEKHIYDGAGHAFNNDTGARYNEAAAVQAWQRTLDWFATHLQ
jgi:carboxymethylenebutenolidase